MARPWRLRHKLVLGLALVVASVGLLLAGALYGLASYRRTARTAGLKLDEMQMVVQLQEFVARVGAAGRAAADPADGSQFDADRRAIGKATADARAALARYRATVGAAPGAGPPDPDDGDAERALVGRIEAALAAVDRAVGTAAGVQVTAGAPGRLADDPGVQAAHADLAKVSTDLFLHLVADVQAAFRRSDAAARRSQTAALTGTAVAVVLVLTLLHYFRVWVFAPIRALQAGVHRVHGGDFGTPIRLTSNDELEELADEFNAMTARLRDVYADLARQVNDRTRQLVRSEKMVSVGFLAAGVAHEINNPLASIAFCAEALERRLADLPARAPGDAEVVLKYLRMMQDEAQRCKGITHRLLDFTRSGGKAEPTDLTQLVGDVIEVARVLPAAKGKEIAFHPAGPLVAPVRAPEVKGVVLNIVVNALDSMDAGGRVSVGLAARDGAAELTVTDTGCGMPADVLAHLFEPFFTKSRTGNGTGLGLATSHLVVDQHGGTIAAGSPGPGKGSTFTVRLPLTAAAPADGPAVVPFPRPRATAA